MVNRVKLLLLWCVYQCILTIQKSILVLGKRLTVRLDDTKIMEETKYSFNITKARKKICLSLHCNDVNNFLYGNSKKIYQLKTKNFFFNMTKTGSNGNI